MDITDTPSPNFDDRREGQTPSLIVLHFTGGKSAQYALDILTDGNRGSYAWAYSVDAGVTWVLLPVTNSATTTVTGLKPGTRTLFRYRSSVKNVWSDWSDPVAVIVD